jgi:YHS domain-containing protein
MPDRNTLTSRSGPRAGLAFALVTLTFGPAAAADPAHPIPWRPDFAQAQAESQSRNLPLWVQFTGPWCHNCRRMEREAFLHPEVVAAARDHFVPVKLRSDVHESLALGFGLSMLPATVLVTPGGEVIAKQEGYADPAEFRAFLDQSLARTGRPGRVPRPAPSSASSDGVALAGYCPVTLVRGHRLTAGQVDLSVRHDGREYRFASSSVRDAFLKDPEPFLPADGGRCPVNHVDRGDTVPGDPRFGVVYRGRLYLCADAATRERFLMAPESYASVDVADQGFCPHCRVEGGLLVRGSSNYSTTHAGRRYLFPDAQHLEAFRASPDKYLR